MVTGLSIWNREFRVWRHMYRESLLLNFAQPLMWLTTFGFALGAYVSLGRPVGYLAFVAPGLLATMAMSIVTFDMLFGTQFKLHAWNLYEAVVTTPVTPGGIVMGEFLWASTRAVVFGGAFLLVMVAFGLVRSAWALSLPLLLVAMGPLFAAPAIVWAVRSRKLSHLFYYTELVVMPMFFFSGAFFPVDRLPATVQAIVWVLPLSHAVNISRALCLGDLDRGLLVDAAYMLLLTGLLAPLAARALGKSLTT